MPRDFRISLHGGGLKMRARRLHGAWLCVRSRLQGLVEVGGAADVVANLQLSAAAAGFVIQNFTGQIQSRRLGIRGRPLVRALPLAAGGRIHREIMDGRVFGEAVVDALQIEGEEAMDLGEKIEAFVAAMDPGPNDNVTFTWRPIAEGD